MSGIAIHYYAKWYSKVLTREIPFLHTKSHTHSHTHTRPCRRRISRTSRWTVALKYRRNNDDFTNISFRTSYIRTPDDSSAVNDSQYCGYAHINTFVHILHTQLLVKVTNRGNYYAYICICMWIIMYSRAGESSPHYEHSCNCVFCNHLPPVIAPSRADIISYLSHE